MSSISLGSCDYDMGVYTSSSKIHPRGRRECATLRSKDTIFHTSHGCTHLLGHGKQEKYKKCVTNLHTKWIDFPIFKRRCDTEEYLDWEWQYEKIIQRRDLRGPERPLYSFHHLKGLALGWWNQAGKLRTLHENTHLFTWRESKGLLRLKYVQ